MTPYSWRRLVRLWKPVRGETRSRRGFQPWLERLEERDFPTGSPALTPLLISTTSGGTTPGTPQVGFVKQSGYSQTFYIVGLPGSDNANVQVEADWQLPKGLQLQGADSMGVVKNVTQVTVVDTGSGPVQAGQFNVVLEATDTSNNNTTTTVFPFIIQPQTGDLQFSVNSTSTNYTNSQVLGYGLLNNHFSATIDALPSSGGTINNLKATLFTEGPDGKMITLASATNPVPGATVTNNGTAIVTANNSMQSFQINGLTPAINPQTNMADPLTVTVSINNLGQATVTIVGTPTFSTAGNGYPLVLDLEAKDSNGKSISSFSSNDTPYFNLSFGYGPDQIRQAYGISNFSLNGSFTGDGAGQTVVIMDPNSAAPAFVSSTDPSFVNSDLNSFDQTFFPNAATNPAAVGNFATTVANPYYLPFFLTLDASGDSSGVPQLPSSSGDMGELPQDIEWVHGLAPLANIVVLEGTTSDATTNINAALKTLQTWITTGKVPWLNNDKAPSTLPLSLAVPSVATSSFGGTYIDKSTGQPVKNLVAVSGLTYVYSSGDWGSIGAIPDLTLGAGYSQMTTDSQGNYAAEAAVDGASPPIGGSSAAYQGTNLTGGEYQSGGGVFSTTTFPQPTYQTAVVNANLPSPVSGRAGPDVTFNGAQATGDLAYNSLENASPYNVKLETTLPTPANPDLGGAPWASAWGTSMAAPSWAALMAITNEGRAALNGISITGVTSSGTSGYTITTSVAHDFNAGEIITIAGVQGTASGVNGTWVVGPNPTATSFTVSATNVTASGTASAGGYVYADSALLTGYDSSTTGAQTLPILYSLAGSSAFHKISTTALGPIASISATGTAVGSMITITSVQPLDIAVNEQITISGVDPSLMTGINGTYTVQTVATGDESFTILATSTLSTTSVSATGYLTGSLLSSYGDSTYNTLAGLGSPVADKLIPDLIGPQLHSNGAVLDPTATDLTIYGSALPSATLPSGAMAAYTVAFYSSASLATPVPSVYGNIEDGPTTLPILGGQELSVTSLKGLDTYGNNPLYAVVTVTVKDSNGNLLYTDTSGQPVLVANLTATTTTTIGAPTITYGSGATISVSVPVQVASSASMPTGLVDLLGFGLFPPIQSLSGGATTFTVNGVSADTYELLASYEGTSQFAPSSDSSTLTVDKAVTTTRITPSSTAVSFGSTPTFQIQVTGSTPASGTGNPGNPTSGMVHVVVSQGGSTVVTFDGDLSSLGNPASITMPVLPAGQYELQATYDGKGNYAGSTSNFASLLITADPTQTGAAIDGPMHVTYPAGATITVTVSASGGTPTGTVNLTVNGGSPIPLTLSGGQAPYTLPANSSAGTYTINANYLGALPNFKASTAQPITVTVDPAATTTTIGPVPPLTVGQSASVTVTVKAVNPAAGTPSGNNLTLTINPGTSQAQTFSPTSVNAGQATFTLTGFHAGTNQRFEANYAATGNFAASIDSADLDVTAAATTTTLSAPAVTFGANGVVQVTVTSAAGAPTGTVNLQVDGGTTVSQLLVNGTATFQVSGLSAGSHSLNARFPAQGDFAASSANGTLSVAPAPPTPPTPPTPPLSVGYVAVGADAGGNSQVVVYNAATGAVVSSFYAFDPGFRGGVRVAVNDINGDGTADIIAAAGPGGGPQVEVIDGTKLNQLQANGQIADAALLASFFAFAPSFTGGVFVATTSSATQNWIAVGAGAGGGPQVEVFTAKAVLAGGTTTAPAPLTSFFAYAPTFSGGVSVALGDVNGDGKLDVITGAGPGGGPQVTVVDGTKFSQIPSTGEVPSSALLANFYAFDPSFTGGVFVSGGKTSGRPFNLFIGRGAGSTPDLLVVDGSKVTQVQPNGQISSAALLDSIPALANSFSGGVRVGFSGAYGAGGNPTILTTAGPTGGPQVAPYDALTFGAVSNFFAMPSGFTGGLFIAG